MKVESGDVSGFALNMTVRCHSDPKQSEGEETHLQEDVSATPQHDDQRHSECSEVKGRIKKTNGFVHSLLGTSLRVTAFTN